VTEALIRALHPDDLPDLERLVAEMQDYERRLDGRLRPGSEIAEAYTNAMLAECAGHDGVVLVAELDDEVVGFIALQTSVPWEGLDYPPGSYALISDLSVTSSQRGRGVGRALLRAAEEHARAEGARDLHIHVLSDNDVAQGLYRSAGFTPYLLVLTKPLAEETPSDS
jgi:ribosomal protein S18 acetylase RimI-like enzyme